MQISKEPAVLENYLVWGIKVLTGILIVVILGIHFVVNHLAGTEGLLTFSDILAYYQNPIIPIMEIGFLFLVVLHALLGLRGIILDLNLPESINRILDFLLAGVGVVAVTYGTWLVLKVVSLGK